MTDTRSSPDTDRALGLIQRLERVRLALREDKWMAGAEVVTDAIAAISSASQPATPTGGEVARLIEMVDGRPDLPLSPADWRLIKGALSAAPAAMAQSSEGPITTEQLDQLQFGRSLHQRPAPPSEGCGTPGCTDPNCEYGKGDDAAAALARSSAGSGGLLERMETFADHGCSANDMQMAQELVSDALLEIQQLHLALAAPAQPSAGSESEPCPYKGPFGCRCEPGECKYRPGDAAQTPAVNPIELRGRLIEVCANICKTMREKYGSPVGDAYDNGVWDQGVRIEQAIRGLATALSDTSTDRQPETCDECGKPAGSDGDKCFGCFVYNREKEEAAAGVSVTSPDRNSP